MAYSFTQKKRIRKNFGRLRETMPFPNLLDIQLDSYKQFLQANVSADKRENIGLHAGFRAVLPIVSNNEKAALDYVKYELLEPEFTWEECIHHGINYAAPLHVVLRLLHYDRETKERRIAEAIDQEIFIGDIPLMTPNGTFVIKGIERVVVSQLHRSPGVYMMHDDGKTYANRKVFSARVIPAIGSWLDFELGFDSKEHRERQQREREVKEDTDRRERDRHRKDENARFVREVGEWMSGLGIPKTELIEKYIGTDEIFVQDEDSFYWHIDDAERYVGEEAPVDLFDDNDRVIVAQGALVTQKHAQRLNKCSIEKKRIEVSEEFLHYRQVAEEILDPDSGQVIVEQGNSLDEGFLRRIRDAQIAEFKTIHINRSRYAKTLSGLIKAASGVEDAYEAGAIPRKQHEYFQAVKVLLNQHSGDFSKVLSETIAHDNYTLIEGGLAILDLPDPERLLGRVCPMDVKGDSNRNIVRADTVFTSYHVSRMKKLDEIKVPEEFLLDQMVVESIINPEDDSVILEAGEMISPSTLELAREYGITDLQTLFINENTAEQITDELTEQGVIPQDIVNFMSAHEPPPMLREEEEKDAQRRIHGQKEDDSDAIYVEAIEAELAKEHSAEEASSIEKLSELHSRYIKGLSDTANWRTPDSGRTRSGQARSGRDRDQQEYVFVRIDRKKKLHVTHMLRALDLSDQNILDEFYQTFTFEFESRGERKLRYSKWDPDHLRGETARIDYFDEEGEIICNAGDRVNRRAINRLKGLTDKNRKFQVPDSFFDGLILAKNIEDIESGEVLLPCNTVLNTDHITRMRDWGVDEFETLAISGFKDRSFIADTLRRDPDTEPKNSKAQSLVEIYNVLRPGEPVTLESAQTLFTRTFFAQEKYELSGVGRMKFNRRLGWEEENNLSLLTAKENVEIEGKVVLRKGRKLNPDVVTQLRKSQVSEIDVLVNLHQLDPDVYIRGLTCKFTYQDQDGNHLAQTGDALYGAALKRLQQMADPKVEAVFKTNLDPNVLDKYDIIGVLKKLLEVVQVPDEESDTEQETVDDIDSLGNRRVRSVGELAEIAFRGGLRRVDRAVKDRLSNAWADKLMPQDLINTKPIAAAVKEFFGGHELSQFMEQTNPLAEVTHKRKVSALGPGGLTREHAGYEVRDVHRSHYGRVCPIETPEGANIGLISSLTIHARTNKHGFIEAPFRVVEEGEVSDKIEYLSFMDEGQHPIAQANAPITDVSEFAEDRVDVRVDGEFTRRSSDRVRYMDVSPKQIVSISAALIPFLEHDEANRGLMGSNQQRQAVPTVQVEAPLVGTGVEGYVARDSGVCVTAKRPGIVELVDAGRIVIRVDPEASKGVTDAIDIYNLTKFKRSNQDTCINQRPIVKEGDRIEANDVLADGPSVDLGELALGQNVRIAFMMWNGFNYEDSILVSERVVQEDRFTSIHILEEVCTARETKMGNEEVTADIPNVNDSALSQLDECGIVRLGAEVKEGDILVGKVTPREESQATGEEKLLRAIFGAKADDVKDTSLRVPSGVSGTVIEVRVFTREGVDKDERAYEIEEEALIAYENDLADEYQIYQRSSFDSIRKAILNQKAVSIPGYDGSRAITAAILDAMDDDEWLTIRMEDDQLNRMLETVESDLRKLREQHEKLRDEKQAKFSRGSDLQPGVLKEVKVYLATKKRIQAGDKMAGRHGNKGVISVIMPVEDMPYDENGEPIDIVLNPLGVPSRMNVGQVLETQLGWAVKGIGQKIGDMLDQQQSVAKLRAYLNDIYNKTEGHHEDIDSLTDQELVELAGNLRKGLSITTPIFDGAKEADIQDLLRKAGLPENGQTTLYDGRTGEAFDRPVTIGYMYMLKLHHLVDDKMHSRSTGAYSMVTQQPLGGKARLGGQRFGEMEVWALEAYGAAHTLQEMLTFKSDDLDGRAKVYSNIVDGDYRMKPGIPESFNVIRREIRSLGLNIELENV